MPTILNPNPLELPAAAQRVLNVTQPPATPRELLERVRTLLDSPDRWTASAYAENAGGDPVAPGDPEAVRWCLWGAIRLIHTDVDQELVRIAVDTLTSVVETPYLACWVVGRSHHEIVEVLTSAIDVLSDALEIQDG